MWIIKNESTKWTFVKIRSKADPSLFISTKDEQGNWINEDIRAIEGTVTGVYFTSRVSPETKEELETVNIKIQDGDELFTLQSAWTFPMRSIVNSILWAGEKLGKVRIWVYGKIVGDKTYAAVTFKNNDERVNWFLSIEEQKELIIPVLHPKTKKVEKFDYSDLNEHFKKHLIDLDNRLNPKSAKSEENSEENLEKSPEENSEENLEKSPEENSSDISEADMLSQIVDDSDDLPF